MAKYLRLHGDIGEGDCAAVVFVEALDTVPKSQPVYVSVNSRGGDFFDGVAIHSAIARRGNVTVMVDGLAASAASYIAMAARKIVMASGSRLMIHSPMTGARGNPVQIESTLNTLRKLEREMAEVYARRSSVTVDEMLLLMRAETWFDGALAKQVFNGVEVNTDKIAASIDPTWLDGFRNPPLALTAGLHAAAKAPVKVADAAQVEADRARRARKRKRMIMITAVGKMDPVAARENREKRRRGLQRASAVCTLERVQALGAADAARDLAERAEARAALRAGYHANWHNVPRRSR